MPSDVRAMLDADWAKFDKHVGEMPDIFFWGEMRSIDWYFVVTPPFPTNWPLQKRCSITYYAYAEYQRLLMHGPHLSRSAPWAKVVLTEGEVAEKVLLTKAIGPVVHGEGGVPISRKMANRELQIIKDGEAHLPNFMRWTEVPSDEAEVKIIREYYCQWALTNGTADLIKGSHHGFFEWLSCPPRTAIPVLQQA